MPERPLKLMDARERMATRIWGIAFFLLYWITRTQAHSRDAVLYAASVRDGPWTALFHPYHLLYNPMVWVLWRALSVVHPHLDPINVAAFLNSILGGLTLGLFARCLLENGATYFWTSFATLGLGLSQCMWLLASENDVYVPTLLALVMAARQALRASRGMRSREAVRAGLWVAVGALFHIVALLFLIPVLLTVGGSGESRARRNALRIASAASALIPVSAAYLAVLGIRHDSSARLAAAWFNHYLRWQSWVDRDPTRLALGFLWFLRGAVPDFGLIGHAPRPTSSALLNDLAQLPFILFTVAVIYLIVDGFRKRPYLTWRFGGLPLLCLAWFLVFELFLGWVGRSSLKFWILTLPPLWAFSAIWADLRFGDPEGQGLRRMSHRAAFGTLAVLMVEVLTTGFLVVAPRHEEQLDLPRQWADNLARQTEPGDFVLVPQSEMEGYLRYYNGRARLSTLEALASLTNSYESTVDTLESAALQARAQGHHAYFTGTGLLVTPTVAQAWKRRQDPADVYRRFAAHLVPRGAYDSARVSARVSAAPGTPLGEPVLLEFRPDTSVAARPAP